MENFTINEFGEIQRKDYFFQSAKKDSTNPLPTNRKFFVYLLLSIVTLGIYALLIQFAFARETNIVCAADGKHTRGFWGALGLSIITLGIYGIVWNYKRIEREVNFLSKHNQDYKINGTLYLILLFLSCIPYVGFICALIWIGLFISQHNQVNKLYNMDNFPYKKQ